MDPLIAVFGLAVGILVGMTGIGGGSILTPLLILVFGIKPVVAIGTDLAYAAVTKTVGGWRHFRHGTVDTRISWWLALGSVPGAIGGVWTLERIHRAHGESFDEVVLYVLAGALIFTSAATLARALFFPAVAERERETVDMQLRHKAAAVMIGLVVGFVLGVSSAGSGALIAIGLILVFRLTPRRVVGTDVFHAAILLWVASAAHLVSGNVDLGLALNLMVGSVPGVVLGTAMSVRVSPEVMRPTLGIVLATAALGILTKAGADVPAPVFVATPIALAVLSWLLTRARGAPRPGAVEPPPAEVELERV